MRPSLALWLDLPGPGEPLPEQFLDRDVEGHVGWLPERPPRKELGLGLGSLAGRSGLASPIRYSMFFFEPYALANVHDLNAERIANCQASRK